MANATCIEPACDKAPLARGMCVTHYHRWNRATKEARPSQWACESCGAPVRALKRFCGDTCRPRCGVDGCSKAEFGSLGHCSAHYTRMKRFGEPTAPLTRHPNDGPCAIEGCPNPMRKKGLCGSHYAVRRARRYRDGSTTTTAQDLSRRDGALCGLCGCDVDMTARRPDLMTPSIDHVVPLSRGGSNHPSNLQLAHLLCNLSKGNRIFPSLVCEAVP
ncbi:HNH endonuclease [Nocardioides sp. URHA0032]|uniref:HNH endonuclease n=1 Tax=Nocardioides sp. URHA0032 TaxID=1380388 RepID=UPI0009DC9B8A